MSIEARHVTKSFGSFVAVDDVSLTVATGELVALLGPSGSGKTTLLRIIAGLEHPDRGQVLFQGEDTTDLRARDRGVGFVFQHYALFKHMTVAQNVAFGLDVMARSKRPKRAEVRERVSILGERGGYVMASSHHIQSDTPIENILAMYEPVLRYRNV